MKHKTVLFFFLLGLLSLSYGQAITFSNLSFRGSLYAGAEICVTEFNLDKLKVIENTGWLNYIDFIENIKSDDSGFFLMNAGIFDSSCNPVGYFANHYQVIRPVNLDNGNGNFYLKPNGALLICKQDAFIKESTVISLVPEVRLGIQSGPLLVLDNKINPAFNSTSTNRHIRCGAGIYENLDKGKNLFFCISENPVSFYEFSSFFKDKLKCQNAICLGSAACELYIPYLMKAKPEYDGIICRYFYYDF